MERIEEFVASKGACEIESLFKEFEDFDDSVYRPETDNSKRLAKITNHT